MKAIVLVAFVVLGACSREVSPRVAQADASAADDSSSPADGNRLAALRADSVPQGFALVVEPRKFEFPRDHGPHPEFRHEWWYVTGHLDSPTGEPFGFELTFFRFALKPPDAATAPVGQSAWRSRQIYMAHFAVSDIGRRDFRVAERFARDALGLGGARSDPFSVSLDDWSLGANFPEEEALNRRAARDESSVSSAARRLRASSLPPTTTTAPTATPWHLTASNKSYALNLTLNPNSPILLNGTAGLSRKSDTPGAASYYYSIPRMTAEGTLLRDGKPIKVSGTVWLDREWGSGSLGSDQQGWDWFALQMDDGSALMFYALRKRNGDRDPHSAGTWLAADGSTRNLSSDEVLIETKGEWTSPRGGRYPARWQLRVPSVQLDVDIQPRLADQELNTSTRYWEGASTVTGTLSGKDIRGKAYVELVGYAKSR